MTDRTIFPEGALELLRQVRYDPAAECHYEGMSGGLVWSDEFPREVISACHAEHNFAFRYVLAYRASLIREAPREKFRPVWHQLLQECPHWPGLRYERQSPSLRELLESKEDHFLREIEKFSASCDNQSSGDQLPE